MPKFSAEEKSKQIKDDLRKVFSQLERRMLFTQLLSGITVLFIFLLVISVAEHFLFLSVWSKTILWVFGILVSSFVFLIQKNKEKKTGFENFYRLFSAKEDIRELNYYLDLENHQSSDSDLVKAAIRENLSSINYSAFSSKLQEYVNSRPQTLLFKRVSTLMSVLAILLLTVSFTLSDSISRVFVFWESFEKPNPYEFTISPSNITLEQGSPFSANIAFTGEKLPQDVLLFVKTDLERDFRPINMDQSGAVFVSKPFNLNNNLDYYIEMDGFKSSGYTATVQLQPRFSELISTIHPPSYTQLDSTLQTYPFSQIKAYQGSKIGITGLLNKTVKDFVVNSSANGIDTSYSANNSVFVSIKVDEPDTVSFSMEDENGLKNKNDFQFVIDPIIDEYPVIEILEPSQSFEMVEPKNLDLVYKATDDFGLTRASLNYELRKAYVDEPIASSLPLNRPSNGVLQRYNWDLASLNLSPLDELSFWIEATDNDGYNGRKTSKSQIIILTIPSLVDYFESLDQREDDIETDLESISESFEEMSEAYEEFEESLRENPNPDFENQRQIEEAQKKQEEVQKKIDELNEKFEEIKEELSENNLLSEETQQAYDELKKLMEEIDDPDLREALERLQQNMDNFTPDQLRQAMENFEFNEQDFQQRLERTIELFKKLKLMSDLEKLAKSFEDQARQEKELSETSSSESETKNKREQDLEQIDKLQEAIEELSENASDQTDQPVSEFQKEASEKLQKEIEEQLKEWLENQENNNEENNSGNQPDQSSPNLQKPYEELAQQSRSLMQQLAQEQQQINIAGLQYILYSLLTLSTEQEDLVFETQATEDRSLAYVEFARDQKNIEQIFNSLSDSLFQLSKDIPQFSNEVNTKTLELKRQLDRSLTQMAERSRQNSSVASRQAYGGINDISFLIANLLEQLQNNGQGNGSGQSGMPQSFEQMIEQLQQMQGDQQQMNEQLQQMINDMQGERLSNDQMERLDQMARQQNEIRKQLQQMLENGTLSGDQASSELQRMLDQMEDTINDLRGGAVDQTLIERQQNILTRMLDAEKAMQEREEEEKEREARRPENVNQNTPPELTLEELEKQIRSRLNDPNFSKYAPDYQKLIERYFELLKRLQERSIQSP